MTATVTRIVHTFPGLGSASLASYLASLGLIRTLAEQADPDLSAWWAGEALCMEVSIADPVTWLVDEYVPTPVVSPWNGGSGFGEKDVASRAALKRLLAADSDRLAEFAAVVRLAETTAALSRERGWNKRRQVNELRNRCPDRLLRWLDTCLVLQEDAALFPPLLGTGGNDGRLDFSTNFHQRLADVLPDLGGPVVRSLAWARDLLAGTAREPLARATVGQFDPGAAGGRNSSPFGAAESQVNPWQFVLMIEGSMCFAAGLTRRQGAAESRAAMPFCVYDDAGGPVPGADQETSRGEIWGPMWSNPLRASEITQLFDESRASWQGSVATQSAQMYAALRSYGVARGLDRFIRFGLHMRNGLAFAAVKLDEVPVTADVHIQLVAEPERTAQPMERISARSVTTVLRGFSRSRMAFVRRPSAVALRGMLADLTRADLAVMRSTRAREELGVRRALPPATDYAAFLQEGLSSVREFRVAAALASAVVPTPDRHRPLRDLILGQIPVRPRQDWQSPVVSGLGVRPLLAVLADLMVWRARVRVDSDGPSIRGFLPLALQGGLRIAWQDLHAFARGELEAAEVEQSFLACLALDWRHARDLPRLGEASQVLPVPELAILQALASGRVHTGAAEGLGVDAGGGQVIGLDPTWPRRFLSGRTTREDASSVIDEAAGWLRRCGWRTATPRRDDTVTPAHVLAALLARPSTAPLRALGARQPGQPLPPRDPDPAHTLVS